MSLKKIAYGTFNVGGLEEAVVFPETAKRHVIRVNNIKATQDTYAASSYIKSKELITAPVESMAIFCNEYIPEHFPAGEYVSYTLTINGKDHKIQPINSDRPGRKIAKKSVSSKENGYAISVGETIKSAFLTITIKSSGQFETPRISSIKVLYGKEVDAF